MQVRDNRDERNTRSELRALITAERGATLVEFAVVLPVFLLFLIGITDLGRAIYYQNSLENAAREGARAGIVLQQNAWLIDGNQTKTYPSMLPYQDTDTIVGRAATLMSGFDLSQAELTIDAPQGTTRGLSMPLTVRIEYTYSPTTSFIGVPELVLVGQSTIRIE